MSSLTTTTTALVARFLPTLLARRARVLALLATVTFLATTISRRLYRFLVPPSHLRHLPHAPVLAYLRAHRRRAPYLVAKPAMMQLMREDANRRGIKAPRMFLTWLLGIWTVNLIDPEDVKAVYTRTEVWDKYVLVGGVGFVGRFFGRNVVSAPMADWKHHRKVVNPAFRRGWATSLFGGPARHLVAELDRFADRDEAIDPADWMARVTLDALSLAAFGHNLDSIRHPEGDMVATYHAIMKDIVNTRDLLNPFYMWTRKAKEMGRLVDRFNAFVFELIDTKTAQLQGRDGGEEGDDDRRDLLEMMVEAAQGSKDFSREDLRANTVIFFLAGHDTTANELCMALYLMGMHRDVQSKARADVIRVLGKDAARRAAECDAAEMIYPTPDQDRALTYLNFVIMETMRLFPSVAKLPRRVTTAPVTLADGTALPKGTLVTIDTFSMHRDPAIWGPDADKFVPDRWAARADADGAIAMHPTAHNYEWAPFGGGQRICLGMQFSLVEQRVILAMMLLRYEWEVVGNTNALRGVPDLAPNDLLRSTGIELRLRRRRVEGFVE
ncbi:hypothetical protein AMAG_12472 [Allomyces macrogynus ATCC 38327]|uniref:Cytochrome P450 n=1 Tax=Allomyces macrogynus (strain ATCC 38327) TaxID=578462 RepID=A0A0L0SZ23_ALLM3|nr:hypothetical protein AMAG_12472 [Allomyces macrogynus ATCC 38327]|eukprot:KNE67747.1 hypothetical protein AMAG_12472 [Allomyces macrogynus ATCC 38327]